MTELRSSHTAVAIAWLDDAHAEETVNTGPRMPYAMLISLAGALGMTRGTVNVRSFRPFEVNLAIQFLDRLSPCRADADHAAGSVPAVLKLQTRLCQCLLGCNDRQYAETVQHG
jgi:hypothetical protein